MKSRRLLMSVNRVFLVALSLTSVRRGDVYTSGRRHGVGRRVWLASDFGSSNYDHQRLPLQTHSAHCARAHWALTLLKNCRRQLRFDQRPLGFQPAASRLSYRGNSSHEAKKKTTLFRPARLCCSAPSTACSRLSFLALTMSWLVPSGPRH